MCIKLTAVLYMTAKYSSIDKTPAFLGAPRSNVGLYVLVLVLWSGRSKGQTTSSLLIYNEYEVYRISESVCREAPAANRTAGGSGSGVVGRHTSRRLALTVHRSRVFGVRFFIYT